MPAAIAYIGAELMMSGIAEFLGSVLLTYSFEIGTTLLLASAYSYQQRQKRKMRDAYNASQVDRFANVSTTTGPRELVLGSVRKGGTIIFRDSCGEFKDRFVMVIAIAAHEIEGVTEYYLNDQKVTLDANGYVTDAPYDQTKTETVSLTGDVIPADAIPGTVVTTTGYVMTSDFDSGTAVTYTTYQRYASADSRARIRLYKGTQTQTADTRLMELFPNVWTANHKLTGIAYLIVEYIYDETAFPSGMPNITAVVKGAKVFDPRSGLTVWSDNPALHALHVAQHPYFGKRTSLTTRELARVSAAANACDETYTPVGGTARPLYRSGIVLPFGAQATDVLDDLCMAMCGTWAYAGGEFFIKAGKYTAPVLPLGEADLLTSQTDSQGSKQGKQITINSQRSKADRVNTINVKIWDVDAAYKETVLSPIVNSEMKLVDGREISSELSLPAVSSGSQAKVIANYMLKESIDSLSITATFKLSAYRVELFDNVALTVPRYGWSDKVFMVIGRKFDATGAIELSMREVSAELYNPLIAADSTGFADNTNLIQPWEISPPETLTVTSGNSELALQSDGSVLSRVKVAWTALTDSRITQGGTVEVQWQEVGTTSWNSVPVSGQETYAYLLGVNDGRNIIIRARTRYTLAVSDWCLQVVHTVVGKTAPPSEVIGFSAAIENKSLTLRWSENSDLDIAGYEVRSSDAGWGTAALPLYRGPSNAAIVKPTGLTSTFYVKAFDRSGNYSIAAATTSYTRTGVPTPAPLLTHMDSGVLQLAWATVEPVFGLAAYEVREEDSNWGLAGEIYRGLKTSTPVEPSLGRIWYVRTIDATGEYSTSASFSYVYVPVSEVSGITHIFADTSLTAATVTVAWQNSAPLYGLDYYEITYNGTTLTTKANSITVEANWINNRNFTVKSVDIYGQKSSGVVYPITKLLPNPAYDFRAQVIDNNVLLYWKLPARTSLPIAHVLLKKGATWETATTIGIKSGDFTSISELAGGTYVYWVAVVDTDGYESEPTNLTTVVSQPPDFIFYGIKYSEFAGTKVNAKLDYAQGTPNNSLTLPVDLAESFGSHFSSRGWASPSAQVAAGFPIFIQPGTATGYYEEVFDFLTVVGSSNVTCSFTGLNLSGTPQVNVTISISLNGSTWTDYPGLSQVFATNFQYVKFKVSVTQNISGDLYSISNLSVKLDSKLKSDSGVLNALSTDTNGTIVNFGTEFVDVISISPSVNSTQNRSAVYDFSDSLLSGTYSVSSGIATISVTGHNLAVGQKVRISPSTGGLPLGVYTVQSVVNANSYTVAVAIANTSGNATTYPNSFRVYVYDTSGVRQSNTVSWTVRGS